MDEFFRKPILNSPYEYPGRHWELDENRQPTNRIIDQRRSVSLITPIPAARKQRGQRRLVFDKEAEKLGTYGRWAFAELTDLYTIRDDFDVRVGSRTQVQLTEMIDESGLPLGRAPPREQR